MTDTTVIIDAGTLDFGGEDMTASGLLIPYGVPARSNLGTFTFAAGDVLLPADVTGASLNVEHRREEVVGAFSRVWEQPEGTFAAFRFANTDAGRAAYADAKSGKRKNLSAEVAKVRIQDGKALPGAVLFAGALVETPAFEGATLLAAADTSAPVGEIPTPTEDSNVLTCPDCGSSLAVTGGGMLAHNPDGSHTFAPLTVTETVTEPPAEAPAEEPHEEKELTMTASAVVEPGTQTPAPAPAPATLLASQPAAAETEVDLGTLFAAMASVKNGGASEDATTLLAALADIKTTGTGALPAAGVVPPAWVGKLWQGKEYVRKFLPLNNHTFGPIDLGGRKGFRINQDTALVQKRTGGEKTELPTGSATTGTRESTRDSYGYAADVAQEWNYLTGGAEVLEAFWKGVANSYAKITDEDALATMFRVASRDTGAALSRRLAPESLPAGTPANAQYYPGVVMLIQAIEAISDADDDPSWAVVNPILWKQLVYTPKELLPEFVSLAVTAGSGTASVDGKVVVKKAPQSAFIGTSATAPQIMAGSKNAIEFKELGETPLTIDALNVAKFGVDRSTVGFLETFVVRPESTVFIGTAA